MSERFDRGASTSNFSAIGLPGITFDAVITMTGTGVLAGRDLVSNTALTVPVGVSHIARSSFSIDVPAALLPSQDQSPDAYGFNLWPRDASVAQGNGQIADFAPRQNSYSTCSLKVFFGVAPLAPKSQAAL